MATSAPDPIIERLEDQIHWYGVKSLSNMRWYKRPTNAEIDSAAMIPLVAASNIHRAVTLILFEGMLQLNQYHENWVGTGRLVSH